MNAKLLIICITMLRFVFPAGAQTKDSLAFSLKDAVAYAMQNNPDIKNGFLDVEIAKSKVKEVTAIGLPNLSAAIDFNDNLKLPVFVFPNPQTGEQQPIRIGTKYQTSASLTFSQLVFDGTYFLGLKAASEYVELSSRAHAKNETDVKADVIKTYFLVLITRENIKMVESNLNTITQNYNEAKAMKEAGFMEQLDVDRLQLAVSTLNIQLAKLKDQSVLTELLLKNKMGMPVEQALKLTESLDQLNARFSVDNLLSATVDPVQRNEYRLVSQQLVLNKLDLKRYQVAKYPTVRGFVNYKESTFGDQLKFDPWYPTSIWGLSLSVPLFTGFGNNARIEQARYNLTKTQNTLVSIENGIKMQVFQAKQNYLRAVDMVVLQQNNLTLATSIYETASKKFKEGVGSNIELLSADQDYKKAQVEYLNAVYDMLSAKIELQVAMGQNIEL